MGTKTLVPTISCNSEKELKIKLKNKLAQHDQNGVHIYIFFFKDWEKGNIVLTSNTQESVLLLKCNQLGWFDTKVCA